MNYNAMDSVMNNIVGKNNRYRIKNSKDLNNYFNYMEDQLLINH